MINFFIGVAVTIVVLVGFLAFCIVRSNYKYPDPQDYD